MPEISLPEIHRVGILETSACCGANIVRYHYFDGKLDAYVFIEKFNQTAHETATHDSVVKAEYLGKVY